MYRVSVGASFGLRLALLGLVSAAALVAASSEADARWRKRTPRAEFTASTARYSHIVVDGNTGDVLHADNADAQRHPASLTKIMTLYLLFERMEQGRIKLTTPLAVSASASEQAPSKLGLREGQTIATEDAIKALVTKSANDVAVVIAEAIGGNEDEFARQMTRKARALGMSRTIYKNASGLPDDGQVTTARDQALLAMAIQDRFPQQFSYFSTPRFIYRGRWMSNHNRLLGKVEGIDGIKTGYTRSSGFNLVSSLKRGPRRIVAVVFGGKTASQRDARMRSLLEEHVMEAAVRRTAPKIVEVAERADPKPKKVAAAAAPAPVRVASAEPAPVPAADSPMTRADTTTTTAAIPQPRATPGSTDPIKPLSVKTVSVKAGNVQTAAVAPLMLSPQPVTSQAHASLQSDALPPPPPGARPGVLGVLHSKPEPQPAPIVVASASAQPIAMPAPVSRAANPAPAPAPVRETKPRSGWFIQVGAFDDETEARERLAAARSKGGKLLGGADPFTEPVVKGDKTLYRARFAGFRQEDAEAACRHLKRNDIVCMTVRN